MDDIVNKFIKQLPLGVVIGCFMIEYKIIPSIFYPGFDDENINCVKSVFKDFMYSRITEGTIISSKSKIPLNVGSYNMEKISDFLGYPCSINDKGSNYKIKIDLTYGDISDTLLVMYCEDVNDKTKIFTKDIIKFITKMNSKLSDDLSSNLSIKKYYTVQKLRDVVDSGDVNDDQRECIEDLFSTYGYKLILSLHNNNKIDMYNKKCKKILALLLRMCELEMDGKFNPSDKEVKSNTIINKLKEQKIYSIKKGDIK